MATRIRPTSQIITNSFGGGISILRDQLSLLDWVLVGAVIQSSLLFLPVPKLLLAGPILLLAVCKLLQAIVAISSYKPGQNGQLIDTPMTVRLDADKDATGGVCVLLLGLQINQ